MPKTPPKRLNLALQGGGAHGAFTWGALDRLLEEPDIEIGRISGASAGALNGAALVTGYAREGREGAKQQLAMLWQEVASAGFPLTFLMLPLRKPGMGIWDDMMPLLSPYQVNPLGMAPLRGVVGSVVDVEALRHSEGPQLFVNAVNVHTARNRVFFPAEMSIDALLASACAPLMFPAVEIDGHGYWDGSYGANPALWPLYEDAVDADIFMVELTPLQRAELPTTAKNILNRVNEIASVNGLVSELRAVDLINRSVPEANLRLHVLSLQEEASVLQVEPSIKRTVAGELFESLRQTGHAACDGWLQRHGADLGVVASVDIAARYLSPYAPYAPGEIGKPRRG